MIWGGMMKVKDFLFGAMIIIALSVAMGSCVMYCTSPEVWHTGEHTEECDGTNNCGCYEKLIQMDKERAGK